MALGFLYGSGGGTPSFKGKIYEAGKWFVDYNNPTPYAHGSSSVIGATLNGNSMTIAGSGSSVGVIGTDKKIDLTNYNTLHCKAYGNSKVGNYCGRCCLLNAKDFVAGSYDLYVDINTLNSLVDYTINVSAKIGEYYIAIESVTSGSSATIYEISLE